MFAYLCTYYLPEREESYKRYSIMKQIMKQTSNQQNKTQNKHCMNMRCRW